MIKLNLPMPPSVNDYYRHTIYHGRPRVYLSKRGKSYKAMIHAMVKKSPSDKRIKVVIELCYRNKRKNDLDNRLKSLFDSLNGILWVDDSQIDVLVVTRGQVGGDCVKLTVSEI